MRTTVTIQDNLLARAKEEALKRQCSLGDIVNEALRYTLIERSNTDAAKVEEPPLKTYGRAGLRPGVDLSDNAALLDQMEDSG